MRRERISNGDLNFIFMEKLRTFDECGQISIAIVPDGDTWTAVLTQGRGQAKPMLAKAETFSNMRRRKSFMLEDD